jgi:hypothetical protein
MNDIVRLAPDVTLADMRVEPSADGQCLLVYCRDRIVALFCAMGSDVEAFEFGNAERICAMELIDRLSVMQEAGYAFFTNSDLRPMAPTPSILQSMS